MISLICGTWKTKQRNKRDKTEKSHSRRKQSGSCQRRGAEGMNEIGEGDQEVQTSRCKINELGIWNVHVGNIVNKNTMMIVLYMYMWYCIWWWKWSEYTKNLPAIHEVQVSVPGLGRSPGEGNDHLLQYPCLENPMDRGAWRATVHGVTKESQRYDSATKQQQQLLAAGLLNVRKKRQGNGERVWVQREGPWLKVSFQDSLTDARTYWRHDLPGWPWSWNLSSCIDLTVLLPWGSV